METVTLLLGGVVSLVFLFFTTKYTYWKRRNVPCLTPLPILGNYKDFFTIKRTVGETVQKIYQQYPNEPFVGAYYGTEPVLIPRDPEAIKMIMTKDFYNFTGRLLVDHESRDPLFSTNLFFASGDHWKAMRQSFNPMFSSAKLKSMFTSIVESGKKLEGYLDHKCKQSDIQNMKSIAMDFTLDVIGSCLYGTKFDTLSSEDNVIRNYADKLTGIDNTKMIKNNIREAWPSLYYLFNARAPALAEGVGEFFMDLAMKSFEARNNKPIGRNDLIDYLLKFKVLGYIETEGVRNTTGDVNTVKLKATKEVLGSLVLSFFIAGFETTASTMSFTFYELAKHPEVQQRLVKEIEEVLKRHNNEITYEAVQEMKYMDMVTSEVMRLYPLLGVITRECTSDYQFPNFGLKVEKGMRIHIPVWAIHHDPKYYPKPEQFNPERFSPEEVQKRPAYTFLGFGEGQRVCIGLRFAKLQLFVGLASVLRMFRVERCGRTEDELHFDPRAMSTTATSGMELKLVPRH